MSKQEVTRRWPDACVEPEYNTPGGPSFYSVWNRTYLGAKRAGCARGLLATGETEVEAWANAERAIRIQEGGAHNAEFSRGASAPSAGTPGYAGTNQEEK